MGSFVVVRRRVNTCSRHKKWQFALPSSSESLPPILLHSVFSRDPGPSRDDDDNACSTEQHASRPLCNLTSCASVPPTHSFPTIIAAITPPLPPGPGPPLPHYNTAHYCPYNGSYLDPVELMLCVLLALSESPRLTTFLPARLKFLSL